MENNNRIASYDSMRLIASFLVVTLHTPSVFPQSISAIIADLARIAVPFFLILSGYNTFYIDKSTENKRIIKSIKKIVYILLVTISIYVLLDFFVFKDFERLRIGILDFFSYKFILFNHVPFCPVGWYLLSYIYILIITYYVKKTRLQIILMTGSILIGIVTGVYSKLFGIEVNSLMWNCSFISVYCFFIIGYLLRKYYRKLNLFSCSNSKLIILIIISCFSTIIEHILINKLSNTSVNGTIFISTFICVIALFIFLTNNPIFLFRLQNLGRMYSLNIYIYHVALHYIMVAFLCPYVFHLKYSALIPIPQFMVPITINSISIFSVLLMILIINNKIKSLLKKNEFKI